MTIPKIVEKETTYFIIVLFPENGSGQDVNIAYKTIKGARRAARNQLKKNDIFTSVMVREEEVFKRNERMEISGSSPVIKYEKKNNKISFSWLTRNIKKYMEA